MSQIDSFRDEFAFLSNFHPSSVWMDGYQYPTVEHAYQAAKCVISSQTPELKEVFPHLVDTRKLLRECRTPGQAKRMGRKIALRSDWDQTKDGVMLQLVLAKFAEHRDLRLLLLSTEETRLVEGNEWGDTYWGVCRGEGQNKLGQILMEVRAQLHNVS